MTKFRLSLCIGLPGELKTTLIDEPELIQIEQAITELNGIDRRFISIVYLPAQSRDAREISVHGGGLNEDRVVVTRAGFSSLPFKPREELLDPDSEELTLIHIKTNSADWIRPYNQTVQKGFARRVILAYVTTLGFPPSEWTTKRDFTEFG